MHRFRITSCIAVVLFVAMAPLPARAASPRLLLPRSWFSIVEPYRYEEARRFERGWNRGADVVAAEGVVRAPLDGRVRFAGDVAGRTVVTIESRVDDLDVVVTLTGLDRRDVREGERVRRGAVVGAGRDVHVGMYDRARRSRYLPVVGSQPSVAPADRPSSPTMSDAIAGRLLDAIRGDVETGRGVRHIEPDSAGASSSPGSPDLASTPPTRVPTQPSLLAASVSIRNTEAQPEPVSIHTPRFPPLTPVGAGGTYATRLVAPIAPGLPPTPPVVRNSPDRRYGVAPLTFAGVGTVAKPRSRGGVDSHERGVSMRGTDPDGPRASTVADGGPDVAGSVRGTDPGRVGDDTSTPSASDPTWSSSIATDAELDGAAVDVGPVRAPGSRATRWSVPVSLAASLAVCLAVIRRRRRRAAPTAAPLTRPWAPILPTMEPRPSMPVRTDGHSIIGGEPLAWADHEAGTSTHHEPELLRHHADLLPERAAAPGPRVHDDRRGRDHPLPATHGSGRVLPDRH